MRAHHKWDGEVVLGVLAVAAAREHGQAGLRGRIDPVLARPAHRQRRMRLAGPWITILCHGMQLGMHRVTVPLWLADEAAAAAGGAGHQVLLVLEPGGGAHSRRDGIHHLLGRRGDGHIRNRPFERVAARTLRVRPTPAGLWGQPFHL
eukprot:scaffold23_cov113-Isochrysis_galbana.AAC.10